MEKVTLKGRARLSAAVSRHRARVCQHLPAPEQLQTPPGSTEGSQDPL